MFRPLAPASLPRALHHSRINKNALHFVDLAAWSSIGFVEANSFVQLYPRHKLSKINIKSSRITRRYQMTQKSHCWRKSVNVADRSIAPPKRRLKEKTRGLQCQTTPPITIIAVATMNLVKWSSEGENHPGKMVRTAPVSQLPPPIRLHCPNTPFGIHQTGRAIRYKVSTDQAH